MRRSHALPAALALIMALPAPLEAAPIADAAAMRRFAASIPDQPFYPAGYRDLRIAAAAEVAAFPRPRQYMLMEGFGGEGPTYDVIDCNAEGLETEESDWRTAEYGGVAIDVARIHGELRGMGYRPEIYEEPLLKFERELLTEIAAEARGPEPASEDSDGYAGIAFDAGKGPLAEEMERRRARLQPDKPKIVAEGGCGGGEAGFVIRTSPPNGKLWVVNAFAFHLCTLKVPDPWDLRACRWTEVDQDNPTMASGRYMYQARWPDGKSARGARIFEATSGDVETITIRR